jgi:hypothetical protein
MPEGSNQIAQKRPEEFESYFDALIFTVLSMSVQIAKFGHSFGADSWSRSA